VRWLHAHRGIYDDLARAGRAIGESLDVKGNGSFVQLGSMFKYFFRSQPPRNYTQAMECDTARFAVFWQAMLKSGIFLPPSQFETNFLSAVHEEADVDAIGQAYRKCL
jgi:glutamate-1-semialdehyde 2,1-aminomutase